MKWDTLAKERGLETFNSKIIFNCLLLYRRTAEQLNNYFRTVLGFLKHHRATLKLKSFKWFQDRCKFVVIYLSVVVTQPSQSKMNIFPR